MGLQGARILKFRFFEVGQWFSPGTLFSSTIKADHHDIAEVLLKVTLNTINPKPTLLGVILSIYVKINIMIFLKSRLH